MTDVADAALLPVTELAPRIRDGTLSCSDLVGATLSRVERLDDLLHSYVTVLADQALEQARRADAEIARGDYRGPLHGIPIAVKDSVAVAGAPTTNGSALMADHVTDYDAAVVSRLRDAGAIIVGKSNMHEWGMGGTCTGMHFGTVRNPWDLSRVPGGSSGGSAAAVSAGLAAAAVAADGWGSIRTPASFCGVVGLKPSYGLVSRFGELPPTSSQQHQLGPITRSAGDAALVLAAIAGHDPRDPTSLRRPVPERLADTSGGVQGLRIGLARSYFLDDAVPAVAAALRTAAERFASLGARLDEVDIPSLARLRHALVGARHESQSALVRLALECPDGFASQQVRLSILAGEFVRDADARRSRQVRNLIRAEIREVFERVDLVLTPCNSTTAFPIGTASVEVGGRETVDMRSPGGQSRVTTRLTVPWNLAGTPAISLPSGEMDAGLPIAIQLAGPHWHDGRVLRAAKAYEAAFGGYRRPPLETALDGVVR